MRLPIQSAPVVRCSTILPLSGSGINPSLPSFCMNLGAGYWWCHFN